MKKILSLLLTLAMVLSWCPSAALATKNTEFPPGPDTASLEEQMQRALFSADLRQYSEDCEEPERYDPDETIRVIVEMKAAPAYEVASTASTDALKSAETAALKGQEATIQAVRKQLGLEPVHRTACLVNMVTYDIRRGDVKKLEELPGVVSVTEAVQYEVEMYTSKDMANVLEAWGMGETGYTGKGMTIAIIDTGVNYLHKDMVQNPDTMKHTQAQMQEMIDDLGHGKWYSDKVPFGYSYISGNDNILNPDRIHGYHVAGISAANGDEEDGGIAGVAPDAQIFAMQVYDANSNLGGLSDDIICAIEDAVKLGADVINLSLGSDNGFYETDRYIQAAVNAARDKGAFVSVAAGNSGTSSTRSLGLTGIWNNWNRKDTATVGDPATASGAVAVASVNSRSALANSLLVTVDGGQAEAMACIKLENADFLIDSNVTLYDAGDGAQERYLDDNRKPLSGVAGTVAIAQFNPNWDYLGQLFAVLNPSDAGCAGVIFYNPDPESGDTLTDISYTPVFTENAPIPYAYVSYADGQALLEAARAGKTASFGGYGGYVHIVSQRPDTASGFSSWGPTSSLELKPELAAPGGNVYSLAGDNGYEFMSGTSMATPFVSGAAAIVKQYVQETGLEVDNVPEFIRKNLMNTAAPVMNTAQNNYLYSVRQVGAGLINVEAAVSNTVLATYGEQEKAAIELGDQLGTATSGVITLKNYGNAAVTYTPNNDYGVFTDYTDADYAYYDVPLEGASVTFDKDTVTVPAGGAATVTFTLTLPENPNGSWAEGYIGFTANTEGAPSLSMPFMGFIGDWDAEPIIDAPEWEDNTVLPRRGYDESNPDDYGYYGYFMHGTSLMSVAADGNIEPLGAYYFEKNPQYFGERLEPQTIAISPNGDNNYDVAIPWLGLLRDAYEVRTTVADSSGKVIADLGTTTHLTRLLAVNATAIPPVHGKALTGGGNYRGWDGTVYDQKTGTYVTAPEGDYTIRLQSRVREGGDWQTVEMPLAIDLTKPVITELNAVDKGNGTIVISFKANDAHGLYRFATFCVNENSDLTPVARLEYNKETQTYSFKMNLPETPATDKGYHVTLMIADRAGNTTTDQLTVGASTSVGGAWSLFNLNPDEATYTTGSIPMVYQIRGFAPAGSTAIFNGREATFDGTDFVADVLLTEPVNTIQIQLTGPGGYSLFEGQATVVIDNTTPRLGALLPDGDIRFTACGNGYGLVLDEDLPAGTTIPLKAKLHETSPVFMTYSDRIQQSVARELQPDKDGYIHFSATLRNAPYGSDKNSSYVYAEFQLYAKDAAGLDTTYIGSVWTPTSVEAAAQTEGLRVSPYMAPVVDNMDVMDVVYGSMLQEDGAFRVSGYLYNPVDAVLVGETKVVVNEDDLTWYCDVSLTEGVNTLTLSSQVDGETYSSGFLKLFYSKDGPILELDLPEAINGKYYVDTPEFTFTGRVKSLGDDISLIINDFQILNANNYGHNGYTEIVREFTHSVSLTEGDNYFEFILIDVSGMPIRTMVDLYYGEYVDLTVKSVTVRGVTASQNENTFSVKLPYDEKGLPTDASEIQIALNNPEASASSPITVDGGKTWTFTVSKGDASATYTIQVSMEPSTICTHEKTELKNVKEATCTEPGYTGDEICTVCGETLKKGQEIPALGHDFSVKGETVAPTETEEGYTVYQCSRCDATEHRDIVPATGHKCPSQAFADLDTTQWYHEYTDYVIGNGLMNGVGNNRFAPNGSTTRAMLVTTLYRLADSPEVGEAATFTDAAEGAWYADAIAWAQDVGIAKGVTETRFAPNSNVTREQAATFLYRFVTEYLKVEPAESTDLSVYKDADKISGYAKTAVAWATAEGLFQGFEDGTMQPKGTLTRAQMAKLLTILDTDA